MTEKQEKKAGYLYEIVYDLGNGRQFRASGNFIEGASEDEMYAESDKILNVADRVRSRCEIELLNTELEVRRKALRRSKDDLTRIQEKKQRTHAEENQIISIRANIEKIIEDVSDGEKNLVAARERANGKHVMAATGAVN